MITLNSFLEDIGKKLRSSNLCDSGNICRGESIFMSACCLKNANKVYLGIYGDGGDFSLAGLSKSTCKTLLNKGNVWWGN